MRLAAGPALIERGLGLRVQAGDWEWIPQGAWRTVWRRLGPSPFVVPAMPVWTAQIVGP